MTDKKHLVSFLLAICVTIVMLFSVLYIAAESNHDCANDSCPICYQINVCEHTLKTLSTVVTAIDTMLTVSYWGRICMPICPNHNLLFTLVTLKVKLSN